MSKCVVTHNVSANRYFTSCGHELSSKNGYDLEMNWNRPDWRKKKCPRCRKSVHVISINY